MAESVLRADSTLSPTLVVTNISYACEKFMAEATSMTMAMTFNFCVCCALGNVSYMLSYAVDNEKGMAAQDKTDQICRMLLALNVKHLPLGLNRATSAH